MTENKKKLAKAAFMIMVATVVSRFAGFFREIIMANYFGLSPERGAFTVAYRIPNLVRTLVADTAITAAFIPVFTHLLAKGEKEEAFRAASSLFSITIIFTCILTALSMIFMPFVIKITAPGFSPDESLFTMTVNLSLIIFPTVIFLGITGIVTGVLNSFQHFAFPATAPILWNLIIIFFLVFYEKQLGIYSAAWGVLIATVFQLLIQLFPLRGKGWRFRFAMDFKNRYVAEILTLILPVTLSLGVINFNAFVDTIFASFLGPDRLAAIDSAFRIFHLPMGVFAVAIGTVLFPVFSSLIAKNDFEKFKPTLVNGISQIFFMTIPVSALFISLSVPIVKTVYERGAFSAYDTKLVALALVFFSIGIPFASANTLLNRGFYSLRKNWIPVYLSCINLFLNALLDWILMKPFSHGGICFSTSLVSAFNFIGLLFFMRREIGFINLGFLVKSFLKIFFISAVMSLSSYALYSYMFQKTGVLPALLSSLVSGCLIFIFLSWIFKVKEFEIARDIFIYKKKEVLSSKN